MKEKWPGNDYGFSEVFSRGVQAHGKKDDVLIGLSTSGNSENVIRAVAAPKDLGMKVILQLEEMAESWVTLGTEILS